MKQMAIEQGVYAQVIVISRKDLIFLQQITSKMKQNLTLKVDLQDQNDGLILTQIGLK